MWRVISVDKTLYNVYSVAIRIIYLSLHCRHQNDSCIKMGSDESHFNVSLIVRDKVARQCQKPTTFEERRAEAESNRGRSAYKPSA